MGNRASKPRITLTSPVPLNGKWNDLIDSVTTLTEGTHSPDIFRKWSAISLVAGALERRVWLRAGDRITFPNLYVVLVAHPGVGKQIVEEVRTLWRRTTEPGSTNPAFHVAPQSVTKASLIDDMAAAKTTRIVAPGTITYQSLLFASEEFGVLLPDYDRAFIGKLNYLFDNKDDYEETRRHGPVRRVFIEYPQLNILGGAQPAYFQATFPDEAWTTGLSRRIIMIYAGESKLRSLFYVPDIPLDAYRDVLLRLGQLSQMYGEVQWGNGTREAIDAWHLSGEDPKPEHSKLVHYLRSRYLFVMKLALVSAVSRTGQLVLELGDLDRAWDWLFEAEAKMPDVFRAMVGKSDMAVIEGMHIFAYAKFVADKKPLHTSDLWRYLSIHTTSDKIQHIINTAVRSNYIGNVPGAEELWIPRPKHTHGLE